ncbi:protein-disulfide reductase DsbD [Natronospirillum operosum]|uniref:protein-disulfide reductase DsbD n=1 Tax=Natronospirillum operosum TaxID=2759953 RepID=UPI0014366D46|nr:protein-disulfide reductase DsbD [Natronospirillum operosum]
MHRLANHLLTLTLLLASSLAAAQEFLPVDEAMPMTFHSDGDTLVVDWVIEPEHYMYRDMFSIRPVTETDPEQLTDQGEMTLSNHHVERYDPTFDEVMPVYYEYMALRLPVTANGPVDFEVRYQGCAEAGLCYPPQTRTVTFDPTNEITGGTDSSRNGAPVAAAGTGAGTLSGPANLTGGGLAEFLAGGSLPLSIGLFFLLGIGLVFTPCVLPMIPIMSALVLGEQRPSTPRALAIALTYVLAMALTYAVAGVIAASLGAAGNIQAALQQPWVLTLFALLFALLALAMFGLFNLQTPGPLSQWVIQIQNRIQQGGLPSVAGIGALSALVVSPCVTAPLAGALIYISASGDAALGFGSLFALGLGMGVPLILVAVGGARWLPRSGPWMQHVRVLFGMLLLGVAIWLLSRWLDPTLSLGLWGLLALGYAIWLGALDRFRADTGRWRKLTGTVLLVYGMAALWGMFSGGTDPLRPIPQASEQQAVAAAPFYRFDSVNELSAQLAQAAAAGEPVMLDFYADWCVSCRIMERRIFEQADVQAGLSDHRWLQIDITRFNAQHQQLLDEHGLFGPPALLFYTAEGELNDQRTIQGELSKRQFVQHLGI